MFKLCLSVPGPVVKLMASSNGSKTILVRWDKPINSSFCIQQYEIVYCYDIFICSTIITQVSTNAPSNVIIKNIKTIM